jgi:hypothetical protein
VPTEASPRRFAAPPARSAWPTSAAARRTVPPSPASVLAFVVDPAAALRSAARLAAALVDCDSLDDAQGALAALGVRTELDYGRTMVRSGSANSSS